METTGQNPARIESSGAAGFRLFENSREGLPVGPRHREDPEQGFQKEGRGAAGAVGQQKAQDRVADVLRGERGAVVELHALADREGVAQAVLGQKAVFPGGDQPRQHRFELRNRGPLVENQGFVDLVLNLVAAAVVLPRRVQAVGVADDGVGEGVRVLGLGAGRGKRKRQGGGGPKTPAEPHFLRLRAPSQAATARKAASAAPEPAKGAASTLTKPVTTNRAMTTPITASPATNPEARSTPR